MAVRHSSAVNAIVPAARARYLADITEQVDLGTMVVVLPWHNPVRVAEDDNMLDAFLGDSAPSHLMTREAFQSIHNVLAPNGTLVINSFGKLEAGEDFLATSLYRTLKSVFKSVVCHFNGKSNFFYVASDQENLQPNSTPNWAAIHYKCRAQTQETFFSRPTIPDDKGIILTDDYNPVDYYDAKNRQTQRRLLALSIRDLTTSSSKEE